MAKEWEIVSFGNNVWDNEMTNKIAYRIDDMLNAIQEVTLDAGGLLDKKQEIINMSVGELLEIFARNGIYIDLKYRKPFEFKLRELKEKETNG